MQSKHTTRPLNPWHYGRGNREMIEGNWTVHNSHVWNMPDYPVGNWNRHKKRKVPSRTRTMGRLARYLLRHGMRIDAATRNQLKQQHGATMYLIPFTAASEHAEAHLLSKVQ